MSNTIKTNNNYYWEKKTYIPRCIIHIKQLDLVTILLEISLYVGGRGGRETEHQRMEETEREREIV